MEISNGTSRYSKGLRKDVYIGVGQIKLSLKGFVTEWLVYDK
jgi:hypothetical protein